MARLADTALPSESLRPSKAADKTHTADQARVARKVTNLERELLWLRGGKKSLPSQGY